MIIVLRPDASEREVDHIIDRLRELGLKSHISTGQERTIIGVIGDDRILAKPALTAFPASKTWSRSWRPGSSSAGSSRRKTPSSMLRRQDRRQQAGDYGRTLCGGKNGTNRGDCS